VTKRVRAETSLYQCSWGLINKPTINTYLTHRYIRRNSLNSSTPPKMPALRHSNRHSIREIKISCCSMWPAVLRIGFKPAKNWLDASMGLARTSAMVR
jgi:hypothetical protein